MSMFRRMLLIAKLLEDGGNITLDFQNGIVTLNDDGHGAKTTINGSEVIISE